MADENKDTPKPLERRGGYQPLTEGYTPTTQQTRPTNSDLPQGGTGESPNAATPQKPENSGTPSDKKE